MIFGENLKAARLKMGMSQKEFAERVGLRRQYIYRVEDGRQNLTLQMMAQLAEALGQDMISMLRRTKRSRH
ncbi:MAG: helix-turn-helix transcriptional regulator [Rhodospirillales bacterium]|nr:helix-turn-helix transcriptional regulator [Acetobacter sp.]